MKKESGQVTLEYILITLVLIGITIGVQKFLTSSQSLTQMIQSPWGKVAGMLESGVWLEASRARPQHPGHIERHLTFFGEREQ